MELNTGNARHRAKELAPSQSPEPWPVVGIFPGHGAGSWRKLSTVPVQLLALLVAWIVPTPATPSQAQETQIYSNCQGQARPGLQVWAASAEIPEPPETWAMVSAFFLF